MFLFRIEIPLYVQAFTLACIIAITLGLFLIIRRLLPDHKKARATLRQSAVILIGYLIVMGVVSYAGFFHNFDLPPRPPLAAALTAIVLVALSIRLRRVIRNGGHDYTLKGLTLIQVWRFLPETLILLLIHERLVPDLMTFTGTNLDIFAPLMALMIRSESPARLRLLLLWNLICPVILTVTVVTALLAAPTPLRSIFTEIPNAAIGSFPITALPIFMVPLAFVLHGWSIRLIIERFKQVN